MRGWGLRHRRRLAWCIPLAVALAIPLAMAMSPSTSGAATGHHRPSVSSSEPASSGADQAAPPGTAGYWLVGADGGVFAFGDAGFYGSAAARHLNGPVVGLAPTPDGRGYWLAGADGGVFAFGDAGFYGSAAARHLNGPVVGLAPTPDGRGYWLAGADGGVFAFGDAGFYGSAAARHLNGPVVGLAPTPDGRGYWLVGADGGVFSFGDAGFYGSAAARHLNGPVVGLAPTPDGRGYWLVGADGGVFAFGDAGFYGSAAAPAPRSGQPVGRAVGIASSATGGGYWVADSGGQIAAFGDAPSLAAPGGTPPPEASVGFAVMPPAGGVPGPAPSPVPVVTPAPLTITSTSLPVATVRQPYSADLDASGGSVPYAWSITGGSLPDGLALSPSGAITGTSDSQSSTTFTVRVLDASRPAPQATTATLSITVSPGPALPLSVASALLPNATVGAAYSASVSASGGTPPYSWTVASGSLPPGLSLAPGGQIAGRPTLPGESTFTVQVTDTRVAGPEATFSIYTSPVPIVASPIWSGYAIGGGPFTSVSGTFTVPQLLDSAAPGEETTEWVGIDGAVAGDESVIQAGVDEYIDPNFPGRVLLQPWWEIFPAAQTNITNVTASPGDVVTVQIEQLTGITWEITLTDETNGESFTTTQPYGGSGLTAEWIVEAPTLNGQALTLAPFGPLVNFSHLLVNGSDEVLGEAVMIQNFMTVSTPSALTANGFNVAYGNVTPEAP